MGEDTALSDVVVFSAAGFTVKLWVGVEVEVV